MKQEKDETMRSNKRALRRFQKENKIKRAQQIYAVLYSGLDIREEEIRRLAKHNYNHLKICSCFMCGHQRKWHGLTLQERRSLQLFNDD